MFPLVIATVDKVLFEGDVRFVTCPGREGELTVLRNHIPFITPLKKGTIRLKEDVEERTFDIERGLLEVTRRGTTILL